MICKKAALLITLVLVVTQVGLAQNNYKKQLDDLLSQSFKANNPGCSVVIGKDGNTIYSKSIGIGNLELNTPITGSSVFLLGSVAKQFTGYAVATLVENGKINLSDDIKTYLPELPNFDQKITIEDLIHHKSGLIEQYTLLIYEGFRLQDAIGKQDVMRVLSGQNELDFEPGTNYTYSNSNYRLLAQIVENVTDMPFELYMKERVFEKLGMTKSNFITDLSTVIPNKVSSYQPNADGSYNYMPYNASTVGSTGLWSSSEDLEKWLKHLIVMKNKHPEMYNRIKSVSSLKDGTPINYGYGWEVDELFGKELLYHNGVDVGYNSQIYFFPNEDLGIVVVSNNNNYSFDFANEIAAVFLGKNGLTESTTDENANKPTEAKKPIGLSRAQIKSISGKYELGDGSILEVKEKNSKLYRSIEGRPDEELAATSPTSVYYKNRPEVALRFANLSEEEEHFKGFHLAFNGTEVEYCMRIIEPDDKMLKGLVGIYKHPTLQITLNVGLKDGKLRLSHYRHDEMVLNPTSTALKFSGTDWWINRVSFRKDASGTVSLHLLNPPSGERLNGIRLERQN